MMQFLNRLMIWALLSLALFPAAALARKHKKAGPPTALQPHIAWLAEQLTGITIPDAEPQTSDIEKLVADHFNSWMANRSPSVVEVQRQMDSVFSGLSHPDYETSMAFRAPWNGRDLIGAGYTLSWSDIWRVSVVELFESSGGKSHPVGTIHFFPGDDLRYLMLPPSASGAFRLIVYGSRLGKSHPRLSAALYSFDGKSVQKSWDVQDLFDGKLRLEGSTLRIDYLNEDEFIHDTAAGQLPPRHQQVLKITPQGITLESEGLMTRQAG